MNLKPAARVPATTKGGPPPRQVAFDMPMKGVDLDDDDNLVDAPPYYCYGTHECPISKLRKGVILVTLTCGAEDVHWSTRKDDTELIAMFKEPDMFEKIPKLMALAHSGAFQLTQQFHLETACLEAGHNKNKKKASDIIMCVARIPLTDMFDDGINPTKIQEKKVDVNGKYVCFLINVEQRENIAFQEQNLKTEVEIEL